MHTALNKLLQIFRVAVATLHHGGEISMQLHRDFGGNTPLLQEVTATVRLCCSSNVVACSALALFSTPESFKQRLLAGCCCILRAAACGLGMSQQNWGCLLAQPAAAAAS